MSVGSTMVLPRGTVLPQEEVQQRLRAMASSGTNLDGVLRELESWSRSIGYFDHLSADNEYLSFHDDSLGLDLRLQVNYSRLGYRKPEGEDFPKCPLCIENVGVRGKERLRIYEFPVAGTDYFSHLTPFPLCPGHFVMNVRRHEPMRIEEQSLRETAAFLAEAPGWLAASNSDIEWAGASVLGHHHVQIFRDLKLPLESAPVFQYIRKGSPKVDLLNWYCPTVRIEGLRDEVAEYGGEQIAVWKAFDPGKSTFNYLMRSERDRVTLYMLFRHSDYRTPEGLRSIKSEGVGIIEMAGEVIVPPQAGMNREENRDLFVRDGLRVIRGIIGGNSPREARQELDFFADFLGN